jgi:hypothetical protein
MISYSQVFLGDTVVVLVWPIHTPTEESYSFFALINDLVWLVVLMTYADQVGAMEATYGSVHATSSNDMWPDP